MTSKLNVKVLGYQLKIKEKYKSYLPSEKLFDLLNQISKMNYDRETYSGRCKQTKDGFLLTMNFEKKMSDSLSNNGVEIIDFWMDKEVDESYHSKDLKGKYSLAKLEEGKIFCHKTHGRFIFKKINNSWEVIVLIERRHHNVWLSHIFKYLKEFQNNCMFEYIQISKKNDLLKKLNSLKDVKLVSIEDIDVYLKNESDKTISDKVAKERFRKSYPVKKTEIKIGEQSLKAFLRELIAQLLPYKENEINEKNLKELSSLVSLKIKAKFNDEKSLKWIPFFSDLIVLQLQITKDSETNEVKTETFFEELNKQTTLEKIDEMFKLIQ